MKNAKIKLKATDMPLLSMLQSTIPHPIYPRGISLCCC